MLLTILPLALSSSSFKSFTTIRGIIGSSSYFSSTSLLESSNRNNLPTKPVTTPPTRTALCHQQHKSFSSYHNNNTRITNNTRSYPKYTIYNEECLLSFLPIQPTYVKTGKYNNNVSVETAGKMILQFIPKTDGHRHDYENRISVALTVEEMGLVISKLSLHEIEISRRVTNSNGEGAAAAAAAVVYDELHKVLTMIPTKDSSSSSVHFIVDFYMNGIGSQCVPGREDGLTGPFQVTAQAGEVEVIKSIFKDSITHLLGWNKMMDIAATNSLKQSLSSSPVAAGGGGDPYEFVGGKRRGENDDNGDDDDKKRKFFSGGGPKGSINF